MPLSIAAIDDCRYLPRRPDRDELRLLDRLELLELEEPDLDELDLEAPDDLDELPDERDTLLEELLRVAEPLERDELLRTLRFELFELEEREDFVPELDERVFAGALYEPDLDRELELRLTLLDPEDRAFEPELEEEPCRVTRVVLRLDEPLEVLLVVALAPLEPVPLRVTVTPRDSVSPPRFAEPAADLSAPPRTRVTVVRSPDRSLAALFARPMPGEDLAVAAGAYPSLPATYAPRSWKGCRLYLPPSQYPSQ